MDGRLARVRANITDEEREEIARTSQQLKQWLAEGCPAKGRNGRPRSYFGLSENEWRNVVMPEFEQPDLNLDLGENQGVAFDTRKREAYRAHVMFACTSNHFWVNVTEGRYQSHDTFRSPFARADVAGALEKFAPGVRFSWMSLPHRLTFGLPWVLPKHRAAAGYTVFVLDELHRKLYVRRSRPMMTSDLVMLGACGLPSEVVQVKLNKWSLPTRRGVVYEASEASLERVAQFCGAHARKSFLEGK